MIGPQLLDTRAARHECGCGLEAGTRVVRLQPQRLAIGIGAARCSVESTHSARGGQVGAILTSHGPR